MSGNRRSLLVAIDGPAASGKSTVALSLAVRLHLELVDSGSMYRAVALVAIERGVDTYDERSLSEVAREVRKDFSLVLEPPGPPRMYLGRREITDGIRSGAVTAAVSPVSKVAVVREEMVKLQRSLVEGRDAVVEGRDIGTAVFPEAQLKVYLDASLEERAHRRYLEYREKGIDITQERVREEIHRRDVINSSRELSPLSRAPDAYLIDTTGKEIAWVVDRIVEALMEEGHVRG